jgi:DNA mismatch repair protein MutS
MAIVMDNTGIQRPPASSARTPMMRQYLGFKEQHPTEVLFFRMGDFYEMFYEDAVLVGEVLGLHVTHRGKGPDRYKMAGIPHHAIDRYLPRMIKMGYRVAICEQTQDPKDVKGTNVVERQIVDIVTPGTLTDEKYLDPEVSNYVLMVVRQRKILGLSWLDLSTGRFFVMEIPALVSSLHAEIQRIGPTEILVSDKITLAMGKDGPGKRGEIKNDAELGHSIDAARDGVMLTPVPDWTADRKSAVKELCEHFEVKSLQGFGLDSNGPSAVAAGALLRYASDMKAGQVGAIRPPLCHRVDKFVRLDGATIRCLELVSGMRSQDRSATLISVLNRTVTHMGARLLHDWILSPLMDREAIEARLDSVAVLRNDALALHALREGLKGVHDLERLAQKLASGRANGRDFMRLRNSLGRLPGVHKTLQDALAATTLPVEALGRVFNGLGLHTDVHELLLTCLDEEPAVSPAEGRIFKSGFNEELDELRTLSETSEGFIKEYQEKETKETGISNLKVGYNRVHGYYIEVTNSHKHKVPEGYQRRQTLKNAERYITTDLKEFEDKVLTANERMLSLETKMFTKLREDLSQIVLELQRTATVLAKLDVLSNFAEIAAERGYVRPVLRDDQVIKIVSGRHPVLDAMQTDEPFVPNDFLIGDAQNGTLGIITGPNMAGKSTYIRQAALLVLMAQVGCYLPAEEAELGLCDRIFTRIGSADDLAKGLSTFMVEMVETANILNNATSKSLIVLDEVGRGTSTYDGVSIAWAMSEYIHDKIKARTLFATHYHELTALPVTKPGVRNYNVSVREWQGEIIFLRKIIQGGADKSYGIQVARLAGVPKVVIERSKVILQKLEDGTFESASDSLFSSAPAHGGSPQQLNLFGDARDKLRDKLKELDPNNLTPIEALLELRELRKLL